MVSKFALTAAASTGSPSLKVAPARSVKVNSVADALASNFEASHGTIFPVAGSWSVSEDTNWRLIAVLPLELLFCGSRHSGLLATATVSVPPLRAVPEPPGDAPPPSFDEQAASPRHSTTIPGRIRRPGPPICLLRTGTAGLGWRNMDTPEADCCGEEITGASSWRAPVDTRTGRMRARKSGAAALGVATGGTGVCSVAQ